MIVVAIMLIAGMFLSAFFSGSETGFYRVTRVRLVLDARGGDRIAAGLLRLTNNASWFVATVLVGNNLANYITSLGIVLATQMLYTGRHSQFAEMLVPVLASPIVFIYGELLPKNLFYQAPNLLLRRAGPLFLFCSLLFAPVAAMLWLFGKLLQRLVGETPLRVQSRLARKELQQVLEEGHHAGLLTPVQRTLAQNLFSLASRPVSRFSTPLAKIIPIEQGCKLETALRSARKQRRAALPVCENGGRRLVGYVVISQLILKQPETIEEVQPLLDISQTEPHCAATILLQTKKAQLARLVDSKGHATSLIYLEDLTEPLLRIE